jgi:chaperonin cofactor prefoldin
MPDLKIGITAQDKTQKAFGAVNTSLGKMKTAFSGLKGSIVGLVGAAGLGALSKNLLSTADRLDKVSKQTGVTTTNLQKFQFAASQSGVGTEGLNKALQTLGKRTGEVVTEGGEFAETFERLGIELQNVDGTTKDMSEIFLQGAEAVSQLGSDAEKAAAANDLFGRSGMELLPLFSGGAKLINAYGKELETAGGIMNDKFITASAAANDAMDKAGRVLKTAFANILMALLPSLKDFAETLSKFGGAFKTFAEEHPTVAKLAIAVTGLALAFATLGGPFTLIAAGIAALVVGWSALTKAMGGAKEAVKGMGLKQLKEQYSKLDEELKGFNQTFEELEKRDPWEKIWRKSGKILVDQARLKKEHQKTMEIVASQIKTLEKQVVTQTKIKKEVTVIAKKSKDLTLHWSRLDKRP